MAMTAGPATGTPAAGHGPQGGRSHLVAGTRITGDIEAPGTIELQAEVRGRVLAETVVVEERGLVEGEIAGHSVAIRGRFDGMLSASAVRIHASAQVSGTILYENLMIESGADVTAAFTRARAQAPA
jgi:cytoskeletal protein CcmA (bactofilin family)